MTPRTRSLLLQLQLLVVARHGPWEGEGGGVVAGVWWPRRSRGFAYPAIPVPIRPFRQPPLLSSTSPSWLSSPLPSSAGVSQPASQPGQIRFALLWLGYRRAALCCAPGEGLLKPPSNGDVGWWPRKVTLVDSFRLPPDSLCSCSSAVSRLIGW